VCVFRGVNENIIAKLQEEEILSSLNSPAELFAILRKNMRFEPPNRFNPLWQNNFLRILYLEAINKDIQFYNQKQKIHKCAFGFLF